MNKATKKKMMKTKYAKESLGNLIFPNDSDKRKKKQKLGSFNDKVFLISVEEKDKGEENKDNSQEER